MNASGKEWYESWFNTPFYHVLYMDRDEREAHNFLDNLITYFSPRPHARILDVACGRGRHSVYLNKKEFEVCGFDLSKDSIRHNKKYESDTLSFFEHDMRMLFRVNYFDIVFNLFSSFGYFDRHDDNEKVVHSNAISLVKKGVLVIDYMNSKKISENLIAEDVKVCRGIRFHQERSIHSGKVIKKISFRSEKKDYSFEEHLRLYSLGDFEKMFEKNNLALENTFGDYALGPFDENTSDRLILVARKS